MGRERLSLPLPAASGHAASRGARAWGLQGREPIRHGNVAAMKGRGRKRGK